jgi:cation diffusion facilitator family transporter
MAHSIAIISDAIHLFSDVLSFSLSAFAVWLAKKKAPKHLTFGYHKIETLAAMANIITIWMVTGFLVYEAFLRIINK